MNPLTISQLLAIAQEAGFTGQDLITAVAVALAESRGNPSAYNPEKAAGAPQGQGSFGLWQIYLHAHPEFAGQNLFDPLTNAAAAYAVYSAAGNTFRPWSTFTGGEYMASVDNVSAVLAGMSTDQTASDSGDGTPPGSSGGADPGTIAGIVIGGAVMLWAIFRIAGA